MLDILKRRPEVSVGDPWEGWGGKVVASFIQYDIKTTSECHINVSVKWNKDKSVHLRQKAI